MSTKVFVLRGRQTRYDIVNPDTAWAGPAQLWFETEALPPDVEYETMLVQDYDGSPPPGTTHILCAGIEAAQFYFRGDNIDTMRGVVQHIHGIPIIATYHVQDCVDLRNFDTFDEDDEIIDAASSGKDRMPTRRSNYPFWVRADVEKLLGRRELVPVDRADMTGAMSPFQLEHWCKYFKPGGIMYLDIETHPKTNTLQCVSFAGAHGAVASFVVYDHTGKLVQTHDSLAAFARAVRRSHVIAHNAMFDLSFLAVYCGIPWPDQISDTMLMWHRWYPEAEKSIAHVISYFTNHPYHKDESGSFDPRTRQALMRLVDYNAKDVLRLREIHHGLCTTDDEGLRTSMDQVNSSIPDYLFAGLHGFEIDTGRLLHHQRNLSARAEQLRRVFNILVGQEINPASPKQVGEYLYTPNGVGYKIIATTDTGAPATDASALYKLRLLHPNNAAITTLLAIKAVDKQRSMLGFKAYDTIKGRQ